MPTVIERRGGGLGVILIGLAALVIAAVLAFVFLSMNQRDAARTDSVSAAASSVADSASRAADSAGDAAQRAAP